MKGGFIVLHHPEWIKDSGHLTLSKLEEARHRIRKRIYILKSLLIDAENDLNEIANKIQFRNRVPHEKDLDLTNDYLIKKAALDRDYWDVKKVNKKGFDRIIEGLLDL